MQPILPDFRAAQFEKGAPIVNPYFPLTPGTIRSYSGSKEGVTAHRVDIFRYFSLARAARI